ncbi:MAG: hypothetical protein ACRCTE_08865 [Cellulosilyticaceae bacterium]
MAALFGKIKDNLDKGVATVTLKSSTVMEMNKCKLFIRTLTEKIEDQKKQLGILVYDMYSQNHFDENIYQEKCRQIAHLEEQRIAQEQKIEELKNQETEILGGTQAKQCSCGATIQEGMLFCVNCGTKIQ